MESFASLSLEDPACTLQSLISMHNGIIAALTQAQSTQGRLSAEFPSAAHQFQHITGCKRSEALYYLKHVPNNDIRAAVIVWHSQVLKEYLSKYQLPEQPQLPPGYQEHELKEQAEAMRAKARRAAGAAEGFGMQDMAQNYLRTNFCSICKVERNVASAYMDATDYNITAAVEEYIARHMLPPAQSKDPDSGLLEHKVLLTRPSLARSVDSCCCRCHSGTSFNTALSWSTAVAEAAAGAPTAAADATSRTPAATPVSSAQVAVGPANGQPNSRLHNGHANGGLVPVSKAPAAAAAAGLPPVAAQKHPGVGPLDGDCFRGPDQGPISNPNTLQQQQQQQQYPKISGEVPATGALCNRGFVMRDPKQQQQQQQQQQQHYPATAGAALGEQKTDSFGIGHLRSRFGGKS